MSRSNVYTYTNLGRKDHVYIGKVDGEKVYKQKSYLLWNTRDILDIANRSGKIEISDSFHLKFEKKLTFSQMYDFLKAHKEYSYNKNGTCLCEICENATLIAKGLSKALENPHDLV